MFSIHNDSLDNINNNYIFSTQVSRPSKSLIDCDLYKKFSKINLNLEILNEFKFTKSKSKDYYLIHELINVFKLDSLDVDSFSISFDSIIINEVTSNTNLILCFENDISLRNIMINFDLLIKELKNDDSLILNYDSLFTYPSAELLLLISNMFKKIKIYYCKLIKQNIIYCKNYIYKQHINVFINTIVRDWNKNSNIRQFGIFIDESLLEKIKKHNNIIFDYYI
jgi:hypothetical protein